MSDIDIDNLRRLVAGWTHGTFLTNDDGELAFEPTPDGGEDETTAIDEIDDAPEDIATMLNALRPLLADHARLGAEVERLTVALDTVTIWPRLRAALHEAAKERDTARAEVARLRGLVERACDALDSSTPDWDAGPKTWRSPPSARRPPVSDRAVLTVVDALERVKEERDTLRLRLAECERERDEAREQVIQRDGDTTPAGFWGRTAARIARERDAAIRERDEALASAHGLTLLVGETAAERDAAVQRLAAPIACPRCDRSDLTLGDLPGHLPCLSRTEAEEDAEARCAQVEAETVAGIVAWLRVEAKRRDDLRPQHEYRRGAADAVDDAADDIEAGAWRGKEGV